ncbi:MAG: PepSY domain-containing protein [Phycisphaerales bacterium]|nr:PepSY domain-containing protein [Phycisphaerales bacterium]
MKQRKVLVLSAALIGIAAYIVYPVYAHCGKCAADGKTIVQTLEASKLTLPKAIETAEKQTKGKVLSIVPALDEKDAVTLKAYSMVGDKITRVDIDGKTGSVIKTEDVTEFPIAPVKHSLGDSPGTGEKPMSSRTISNQTVDVACGGCVFHMTGVQGCELAVKIDGKNYLVTKGAEHINAHEYCTAAKKAIVSGRIEGDNFIATKFEVIKS